MTSPLLTPALLRPRAPRAQARGGFTLVELLVVIAVIAILTALAFPAISAVRRRSQVRAAQALLQRLRLALETYSDHFGDYPPSRFKKLGLGPSNGLNEGVECMVRCLSTGRNGGPFIELKDQELGNTDQDSLASPGNPTGSVYTSRDLLEVVDPWGNPLVYLHNADYDAGDTVALADGSRAKVGAAKSAKTGQYHGLTSFQLWSAGPDGKAGTSDDLRVWGQ